ncbi:hypothetical protein HBI56_083680 [Parastagonospora nodorum]|uniref:Uncharacterized protein n=1 Tax=Phaeosphaeria nodorum (strain SN15 / ATCC MYA-4574 / FGSC 10173) TaxID=321614 RepID=A0A7U2I888_PHANO|nr:hypothetical protein HBH56_102890 [Parastagonospora nodorum]QRD04567.1 hypothetical protein JI435_105080 [Parastagonospora nodorum SN15]KAH3929339.1 hypothetical protein HBH54_127520 [Parastagonospora nodorum]KAH3951620.1 hypothetical protein HBH53_061540 [Parastagonospora nodorum]KAH4049212.1 hypothetical protein HBH49_143740 [Parastagonospora nodorum]
MESIGSFIKFNNLRTLILDVHLFRDKATDDDDDDEDDDDYFWNECLMTGNYPQTLHLLDLRGWSWQGICHRISIYEEGTPRDTREFIMMKMVWTVDLRDSEDKPGCVEVDDNLILQDSAVNTLRVTAGNLALADEGSMATTLIGQYGGEFRDVYMTNPGDAKTALRIASGKYREANTDGEDDESDPTSEADEDAEDSEEDSEDPEGDSEEYVEEDSEEDSDDEFEYD